MLQDELHWLKSAFIPPSPCPEFQCLLAGHLRLTSALLTCHGTDKIEYGRFLIPQLISEFLFPASKMIMESQEPRPAGIVNINPK